MNKIKKMQKESNKKDKEIEQLKADRNVKHHHKLKKKNKNLLVKVDTLKLERDGFKLKLAKCLKERENAKK